MSHWTRRLRLNSIGTVMTRNADPLATAALAARTMRHTAELAVAANEVIAARLALAAVPRAVTPAGQAEFARMVPEKAHAFAAAGAGAAQHLAAIAIDANRAALREGAAAARAGAAMFSATTAEAFAAAQRDWFTGWFARAVAQAQSMAAATAALQAAAIAPIHRTATANARRLR